MKTYRLLFFALFPILAVTSCKKDSATNPTGSSGATGTTGVMGPTGLTGSTGAITDIYIVGNIKATNGAYVAACWKNGVLTKLSDSTVNCYANGITVFNNDIYILGIFGGYVAYWKNGIMTKLGMGYTRGGRSAITVQGNDVYAAGHNFEAGAVYWKNQTAIPLSGGADASDIFTGIAVNSNNVYLAGNDNSLDGTTTAVYWTNNTGITLPHGSGKFSKAESLIVYGNDTYITGNYGAASKDYHDEMYASYWKNGNLITVGDTNRYTLINSIAFNGNDIYLAGIRAKSANGVTYGCYWKNGTIAFASPNLTTTDLSDIAVNGTDVYFLDGTKSGYWLNGNFVKLSGGSDLTASTILIYHHN